MSFDNYDPANPPTQLDTVQESSSVRQREKTAVREAITAVCEAAVGDRGSVLLDLINEIREKNGPKAAFDSIVKLLDFSTPRLQRMTLDDQSERVTKMPQFVFNFNGQTMPEMKIIDPENQ
jgi:hypothetical protein